MTTFAYRCEDCGVLEVEEPMGSAPRVDCPECSLPVRRIITGGVAVPAAKGWPMACYASGVNAEQADQLRAEFKRVGVPTEVTKDGDPIYTSASHRKRALKARGFFDRAAYY